MENNKDNDIRRIQTIIINNGYRLSLNQCEIIWKDYSDSFGSLWLILPPDDKSIWEVIKWRVIKHLN